MSRPTKTHRNKRNNKRITCSTLSKYQRKRREEQVVSLLCNPGLCKFRDKNTEFAELFFTKVKANAETQHHTALKKINGISTIFQLTNNQKTTYYSLLQQLNVYNLQKYTQLTLLPGQHKQISDFFSLETNSFWLWSY